MSLGKLTDHLEKLFAFITVAKMGSITHAAKKLNISQAALSQSMSTLEYALDLKLLNRDVKGTTVTEAGKKLLEFSKRLHQELEEVEMYILEKRKKPFVKLKIGTHETLGIHLWPTFLKKFLKNRENVEISLLSGRIQSLVKDLINRELHLIVSVEPNYHSDLIIDKLYSNYLGFFIAPSEMDKLNLTTSRNEITIDQMNSIPILTDSSAHQSQQISIPSTLLMNGLKIDSIFEINSFETAIQLASKGLGVAFLPKRNALEAVRDKKLVELKIQGINESVLEYKICASYLTNNNLDHEITLMINELKNEFR